MGHSPIGTLLMTVPPFAVGFVPCIVTAYVADLYKARGAMVLGTSFLFLVGILLFYTGRTTPVRYTGLFFLISDAYASSLCLLAWVPNNEAAHTRRPTAIATAFCCTNVGGIVSTLDFPHQSGALLPFRFKILTCFL
ncbi:uncharacterized protein A1O9_10375 [Exophiala aquamarina CBS 119918]|uniref:Major facilitator superfamily (MFS) profile domain-containing protein n=1 Tax=Exophiala aquamarina CBS 119918 TaxID=1182545 RepID=A0A072PCW7_9EURO|nr:uncharacterized protein A1O9_10375 [Exophiala aquamarina CBS 119918]KEF53400.1 hypothetical protein A1O9_10375 [Exophiala aquamarina CBS 119918]